MSLETAEAASDASPRSSSASSTIGFPSTPPEALSCSTASVAPFRPDSAKVAVGPVSAPKNPTLMPCSCGAFSPPQAMAAIKARTARRFTGAF